MKKHTQSFAVSFSIPACSMKELGGLPRGTKSKKIRDLLIATADEWKKDLKYKRGKKELITVSLPIDLIQDLEGLDRSKILTDLLSNYEID